MSGLRGRTARGSKATGGFGAFAEKSKGAFCRSGAGTIRTATAATIGITSRAASYTTSEVTAEFGCDLTIDVRSMPEIESESYDCVHCSGVLEHVDDFHAGFKEVTRVLRESGTLLLGLPFRQPIHMGEQDFWRFTEYGIKHMLKDRYRIEEMIPVGSNKDDLFPAAYWVRAVKM